MQWATPTVAAEAPLPVFEKDVRPILKANCFHCHGEGGKKEGGVDLRLRRFLLQSTSDGPVMVPGQPAQSLMLKLVREGEMPKAEKKLTSAEIAVLERWISSGAPALRDEPASIPNIYITDEERQFWSFRPVQSVVPPESKNARVRTPVDAFVAAKLQEVGLDFALEADRRTLLRRLSFDLTGLPPTPEEMEAFLQDASLDAYEKQVDRLLASPRYGERWGRHWLDAAGYADSNGYAEADSPRAHAWHYRDYVIKAVNEDKPWDQFLQEQLAGDELAGVTHENALQRIHDPGVAELLTATGFLRMVPDGTGDGPADQNLARNQVMAETLKVVGSSLLGLTIGCAQCHDHRYDPVSQKDYHQLRAIFEPAENWKEWRAPAQRLYSLYTEEDRKRAAQIEAQAQKQVAERQERAKLRLDQIFEERLKKFPADQQGWIRTARITSPDKRTAEQNAFFKEHPEVNVGTHEGLLNVFDREAEKLNLDERRKTEGFRNTRPPEYFLMALTEMSGKSPDTFVFHRGDHEQPREKVGPAELEVLAGGAQKIPAATPGQPTSGRRLAYARWLTSGKHPLVARVLVNRFWLNHFGRALVNTPGDFGALGERPTHPELLDWLAQDFTSNGWKLKRLHRLLVTSTVYRQASANADSVMKDPENRWLARRGVNRLDAESLRDSVLSVSGKLNLTMFGPPVPVARHPAGQIVTGAEELNANGEPVQVRSLGETEGRRSIYIEQRRSRPLTVLDTFDFPIMAPNCEARSTSTVAPQSLLLMNDAVIVEQSAAFASRLEREFPQDHVARVRRAWQLVFGRNPDTLEISRALIFLTEEALDWSAWCQALLGSNGFLYVD